MSSKPFAFVLNWVRQPILRKSYFLILTVLVGTLMVGNIVWYYHTVSKAQQQTLKMLTQQAAYKVAQQLDTLVVALRATEQTSAQYTTNAQMTALQARFPHTFQGFYLLNTQGELAQQAPTETGLHQAVFSRVTEILARPDQTSIIFVTAPANVLYVAQVLNHQHTEPRIAVFSFSADIITALLTETTQTAAHLPPLQLARVADVTNILLDTTTATWRVSAQLPTIEQLASRYPHRIAHAVPIAHTPWIIVSLSPKFQLTMFAHVLTSGIFILLLSMLYMGLRWQNKRDEQLQQHTLESTNQKLVAQIDSHLADLHHQIAERKQAEQALRQSETRLRGIIETAADCIVTLNEQGLIESYNHACEEMFLYSQNEVINQPLSLLLPHFKSVSAYSFNAIHMSSLAKNHRDAGIRHETQGLRQDNEHFPVEFVVSEFQLQEKIFFSGIIRDITDRKALEKLLQSSIKKLQTTVEQRTRDVKKLTEKLDIHQRLSNWQEGQITSQLTGMGSLRQRDSDSFQQLLDIYVDLLEDYLEAAAFNKAPKRSTIIAFANRLGDVGGGPKDVLDIHLSCIERKNSDPQINSRRMHSFTVEGRLLVIEIMGHLVDYYRLHPAFSN